MGDIPAAAAIVIQEINGSGYSTDRQRATVTRKMCPECEAPMIVRQNTCEKEKSTSAHPSK
jgi:predicted RNA-binding Zn-ribbon protein involved in translation (DUF1610 family)